MNNSTEYDSRSNSLQCIESYKHLNTGNLKYHYRANEAFIIREKVLYGFKFAFLDGIDIFTTNGNRIASMYRIRDSRFTVNSSRDVVKKHIHDFMFSNENRRFTDIHINELYLNSQNTERCKILVQAFIDIHEK